MFCGSTSVFTNLTLDYLWTKAGNKYEARKCLTLSKHFCFSGLHMNATPLRARALNGSGNLTRLGMKSGKFVTIPRKLCNSVTL